MIEIFYYLILKFTSLFLIFNKTYLQKIEKVKSPLFMISGADVSEKEVITTQLTNLGAKVSNLPNYDPESTHLISAKPCRNEKILSSIAAGKWILHISYVQCCVNAGKLLNVCNSPIFSTILFK